MEQVLYRKYRPTAFKEVKGQDAVVEVLKKTIEKNKLSNAYLFYGSRGTGKTTIARIFAKDIGVDEIDIHEIDAASHTSVDDIRDINESSRILPIKSGYKVYILDEAHMLSKSAFNAFLKTLEEPSSHTIFILATTEQEKLPDTIISRCQTFSLNRPSVILIRDLMMDVAKKEGYKLDSQSATLIAYLADGSFRDAFGALQKVIISVDKKVIDHKVIEKVLGVPNSAIINKYLLALTKCDVKTGREAVEELVSQNIDMKFATLMCIRRARAILFNSHGDSTLLNDFDADELKEMKAIDVSFEVLEALLKAYDEIDYVSVKQLPLEIALLRVNNTNE